MRKGLAATVLALSLSTGIASNAHADESRWGKFWDCVWNSACEKHVPQKPVQQKNNSTHKAKSTTPKPVRQHDYIYDTEEIGVDTAEGENESDYCGPNDYKSFSAPEPAKVHQQRGQYIRITPARDPTLTLAQQAELNRTLADFKITGEEAKRLNDMGVRRFKFDERLYNANGTLTAASVKSNPIGINYKGNCGGVTAIQNNTYINVFTPPNAGNTPDTIMEPDRRFMGRTPKKIGSTPDHPLENAFSKPGSFTIGIGPVEQAIEYVNPGAKVSRDRRVEEVFQGYQIHAMARRDTEKTSMGIAGAVSFLHPPNDVTTYTPGFGFSSGRQTAWAIAPDVHVAVGGRVKLAADLEAEYKGVTIQDPEVVNADNSNLSLGVGGSVMVGGYSRDRLIVGAMLRDQNIGLHRADLPSGDPRRTDNMDERWGELRVEAQKSVGNLSVFGKATYGKPMTAWTTRKPQQDIDQSSIYNIDLGFRYWTNTATNPHYWELTFRQAHEHTVFQDNSTLDVNGRKVMLNYGLRFGK